MFILVCIPLAFEFRTGFVRVPREVSPLPKVSFEGKELFGSIVNVKKIDVIIVYDPKYDTCHTIRWYPMYNIIDECKWNFDCAHHDDIFNHMEDIFSAIRPWYVQRFNTTLLADFENIEDCRTWFQSYLKSLRLL